MVGQKPDLSSLNSSSESSVSTSSNGPDQADKKEEPSFFSRINPFKKETCEEKFQTCKKNEQKPKSGMFSMFSSGNSTTPKPEGQSGSMFSYFGFGAKPVAGKPTAIMGGRRKKTQRKQKKNKKNKKGKTNKRKLFGFF